MAAFVYYAEIKGGDLTPLDPPLYTGPYKSQEDALHNALCEVERAAALGKVAKIEVRRVNNSTGRLGGASKRLFLFSCHPETV